MTSTAPRLSIIIPCKRHDDPGLQRLLLSLTRQTLQDVEILVQTEPEGPEYAKACGIRRARGQILGFFCADNDLRDPHFLEVMCRYAQDPRVDGAYTAQYDYVKEDTALSRYFALLGANDPVCWWLGKSDRQSYLAPASCRHSEIHRFERSIPSIGDNGFFIRSTVAKRYLPTPERHFCIDWIEDIRQAKGSVTFWIVKEQSLWHRTGEGFWNWVRRRYVYAKTLYFRDLAKRRWRMVHTRQDRLAVFVFAVSSLLFVPTVCVSVYGYLRRRDFAWFLHPVVCCVLTCLYTYAWLEHRVDRWQQWWCQRWIVHRNSTPA